MVAGRSSIARAMRPEGRGDGGLQGERAAAAQRSVRRLMERQRALWGPSPLAKRQHKLVDREQEGGRRHHTGTLKNVRVYIISIAWRYSTRCPIEQSSTNASVAGWLMHSSWQTYIMGAHNGCHLKVRLTSFASLVVSVSAFEVDPPYKDWVCGN